MATEESRTSGLSAGPPTHSTGLRKIAEGSFAPTDFAVAPGDTERKYIVDLWDEQAGTFASGHEATTYTYTPRDAGDIVGGLNAADALTDVDGIKERYATYFNQTFNRGRLQRATRWQAYRPEGEHTLPLEQDAGEQSSPSPASQAQQDAGGEYGQAAVYNAEVEYGTASDEWTFTNDMFHTAGSLYLASQDLWVSVWGGSAFPGRGVPGESDRLPRWEG